tara:strand:+ start:293 stop:574 length:282 start_codon:yes stop_codon:yes gene_type:complete
MPRKKKSARIMSTLNVGFSYEQNNLPDVLNRLREKVDRTSSITTEADGESNSAYSDFIYALEGSSLDNMGDTDLSVLSGDSYEWFADFEAELS